MIYFGWNGWGPWNSGSGIVWFILGVLWMLLIASVGANWRDGRRYLSKLALAVFCSLIIGGYYGWFAGGKAQWGECVKEMSDLRKELSR